MTAAEVEAAGLESRTGETVAPSNSALVLRSASSRRFSSLGVLKTDIHYVLI